MPNLNPKHMCQVTDTQHTPITAIYPSISPQKNGASLEGSRPASPWALPLLGLAPGSRKIAGSIGGSVVVVEVQ